MVLAEFWMTKIYFLIVNYNSSDLVARLIESIADREHYQVVIINNSPQNRRILKFNNNLIKIIEPKENLGFGKACNLGLKWIHQEDRKAIVWTINPDTYFDSNPKDNRSPRHKAMSSTNLAIAFFEKHPQISILGTAVYNSQGQIATVGGAFTPNTAALKNIDYLPEDLSQDYIKTDWVSGCSLLLNLANFTKVPQFCDRYFLYYEDVDFCLRYSQQGHQIAVTHLLKVIHDTSSITNRNILQKYRHITKSYLIHIEKYGSMKVFILTNIRMFLNTLRLIIFKPQQGLGKAIGIYEYWQNRIANQ